MNRVCSIFAQVLRLLPESSSSRRSRSTGPRSTPRVQLLDATDRHAVLPAGTGQIAAGDRGGLASSEGKLKHLGVARPPKRSTLAYANEHRSWELYQTVFEQVLTKCRGPWRAHEIPLPQQAGEPGRDVHRLVRQPV